MKTLLRLGAGILLMGLSAFAARAAYLDTGDAAQTARPPVVEPPPAIVPPRWPQPDPVLRTLVRRLDVGEPQGGYGLLVFPLLLREGQRGADALTLDEALGRGVLVIRETAAGSVSALLVRNESDRRVFLMAGEMILGGKQNRIVREDVLLPPRSGEVEVPVYCGEQDRWAGPTPIFKGGGELSAPAVRGLAAGSASQDRIWGEIDRQMGDAKVQSRTRSYQELYAAPEVSARLDRCVEALRPVIGPRTVGCVTLRDGRVVGADLFSDPDLCARLWPKIARSYALDVCRAEREFDRRHWPRPGPEPVRQFLNRILDARFHSGGTPGLGTLWRLNGPVGGSVLEYDGAVVHAGLFADEPVVVPMPVPVPAPMPR